jgi:hypothetical protein
MIGDRAVTPLPYSPAVSSRPPEGPGPLTVGQPTLRAHGANAGIDEEEAMTRLTPEDRLVLTREFLFRWELDAETRFKIRLLAGVFERQAAAWGDPYAADAYVETCWTLAQPEHRDRIDALLAEFGLLGDESTGDPSSGPSGGLGVAA